MNIQIKIDADVWLSTCNLFYDQIQGLIKNSVDLPSQRAIRKLICDSVRNTVATSVRNNVESKIFVVGIEPFVAYAELMRVKD